MTQRQTSCSKRSPLAANTPPATSASEVRIQARNVRSLASEKR